jgi:hypothetical protein
MGKRYIDAEKAVELIKNYGKGAISDGQVTLDPVDDIILLAKGIDLVPTADVVEVVRCKGCKYSNEDGTICRYSVGIAVEPEHFCSYGKLKECNRNV